MPVYKAFILNKEINVNYDDNQKEKLIEAVKEINSKLKNFDNQNGKISDSTLLSFLAIKLQAEIFNLKENNQKRKTLEKKINETNNENINLNDKIYNLVHENNLIKKEKELMCEELNKINNQIDIITNLIKKTYEE
tara:strand:+ start:110 stop:517 length:408 start_codon:yes stop_codon:yes gene_type:complete